MRNAFPSLRGPLRRKLADAFPDLGDGERVRLSLPSVGPRQAITSVAHALSAARGASLDAALAAARDALERDPDVQSIEARSRGLLAFDLRDEWWWRLVESLHATRYRAATSASAGRVDIVADAPRGGSRRDPTFARVELVVAALERAWRWRGADVDVSVVEADGDGGRIRVRRPRGDSMRLSVGPVRARGLDPRRAEIRLAMLAPAPAQPIAEAAVERLLEAAATARRRIADWSTRVAYATRGRDPLDAPCPSAADVAALGPTAWVAVRAALGTGEVLDRLADTGDVGAIWRHVSGVIAAGRAFEREAGLVSEEPGGHRARLAVADLVRRAALVGFDVAGVEAPSRL